MCLMALVDDKNRGRLMQLLAEGGPGSPPTPQLQRVWLVLWGGGGGVQV